MVIFGLLLGITSGGVMPSPETQYTVGGGSETEYGHKIGPFAVPPGTIEEAKTVSVFSIRDLIIMLTISSVAALSAGAIAGAVSGITIFGIGSPEAGRYAWKAALFMLVATWAGYVAWKFYDMMPPNVPSAISTLLILPPLGGFLIGMFMIYVRGAGN